MRCISHHIMDLNLCYAMGVIEESEVSFKHASNVYHKPECVRLEGKGMKSYLLSCTGRLLCHHIRLVECTFSCNATLYCRPAFFTLMSYCK